MSLALARKYRPKRFADVAVQSHVSTTLKGAIARGRVAHGYLLCGPRGVGKTTLARVLAMALNCERRGDAALDGEPCGECASCRRIWAGSASLDVVEIDAASNRGVDDARELRERAMYAPSGDNQYKVYIVDEAHMLTREAWNALLKILEEPPPRVVFVFATTEPQKIAQSAAPVLSRLQRFDFKRIGPKEIRERLTHVLTEENITAEPEALAAISRAADGSMRDALSLTDQVLSMGDGRVTAERVRDALGLVAEDEFIAMLDLIADRRAADVFPAVARLGDAGVDFGSVLTGLADILRSQLAVVLGGSATEVSERARDALDQRRDRFTGADLCACCKRSPSSSRAFERADSSNFSSKRCSCVLRFSIARSSSRRFCGRSEGRRRVRRPHRRGLVVATGRAVQRAVEAALAPFVRPEPRPAPRADGSGIRAELQPRPAPVVQAPEPPRPLASPARATPLAAEPLDLNKIAGRWDALVDRVRDEGKPMLASALGHASPVAVTAAGVVTIELDEPNDIFAHAVSSARVEIAAALKTWFSGVERVDLRRDERSPAPPPKRLTDEMVRAERIAALRKRDPVLGAAIDALDLDVAD